MIIQSLKSLEINIWYWGNSMQSALYKLDFHGDKVCNLWSKLIIQKQSDECMNGSVCSVEAMGQVPIMLIPIWPGRGIVYVVKTYLLIFSISFWVGQKNSPTGIRQNFAKNIHQNKREEWFYEFWMLKRLGNTLVYFLEANFLWFLGCRNLDTKFSHFIISNSTKGF